MKTLTAPAAYGYQELRLLHQRYMMFALFTAIFIQFAIVGGYHLTEWMKPADPPMHVIRIPIGTLLPPPSTHEQPAVGISIPQAKLAFGLPVPVPDCEINTDSIFASQGDIANKADQIWKGLNQVPGQVIIPSDPPPEPDPLPNIPLGVDRFPEVVMTSVPEYPDLAKRIGLEGSVTVNILVDKEGKVKKTLLMKSTDDVFTQPALEAAKKWIFTPAIMNGRPVLVWVAIPFRFRLAK